MGVNIDETDFDVAGNVIRASDCIIGSNDIDSDRGKRFRDVFYGSNKYTSTPLIGLDNLTIPSNGYATNFNTQNISTYDFASTVNNGVDLLILGVSYQWCVSIWSN
jgi:hypothetical protein